ncbi:MAG: hypothetical protein E6F99_22315 [Actinobacteria bacterium]|nr:MAG: hypothetical protein E6F99_22315 [Actinomycetota bacterium]
MPDNPEAAPPDDAPLITPSAGLVALLAEAEETWVARARDGEAAAPGWRPFEDAFPTFYQFTNRPR